MAESKATLGRRVRYLAALASGKSIEQALLEADMSRAMLHTARMKVKGFRDEEVTYTGTRTHEHIKADYLFFLKKCFGNTQKALLMADFKKKELDTYRRIDSEFAEKEQEILAGIVAEAEEQAIRVAVGAPSKLKDTGHNRFVLGKLAPDRWGDKPREIEHKFSGNITIKNTTAEILEILGDEDIAGLLERDR